MSKIYCKEPSDDLREKIINARLCIISKAKRAIRCPYCEHTALVVYADASGYVQTKCTKCKRNILIDLISMRRMNLS